MEFKVKEVGSAEEKSKQEIEQEVVQKVDMGSKDKAKEEPDPEPKQEPEKPKEDVQEPVQQEPEQPSLTEEDVLSFIKNKYNKEISSVNDLFEEKQSGADVPEDIAAYLEYREKTGRGFDDYMKLNRDYDSMNDDQILKEYKLATEVGLEEQDVIDELNEEYSWDEDDDLSDKEINRIKRAKKKAVAEAKKFFEDQKKMFKEPVESRGTQGMSEEDKKKLEAYSEYTKQQGSLQEQQEKMRQWYEQKTNELFSNDFEGFEFKVNDNKKLTYKPGSPEDIKKAQLDPSSFTKNFLDENGLIKDAKGFHRALSVARDPEGFARFFYEQGQADAVESDAKSAKNINMSSRAPEVSRKDGVQVKAVNTDSGRGLKIKSRT